MSVLTDVRHRKLMVRLLHVAGTIQSCREEAIHFNDEASKLLKLPAQVRCSIFMVSVFPEATLQS